jgi:hypothetical protein
MKNLITTAIGAMCPCCRDIAQLSSQSLDRKLTLRERIGMRIHGWICSWCIDYSNQVQIVSDKVKSDGESLAELNDEKLSDECRERIRVMMQPSSQEPDDNS